MAERGQLQSQTELAERGVIDAPGGPEAHGVPQLIRIHAAPVVDHRQPCDTLAAPQKPDQYIGSAGAQGVIDQVRERLFEVLTDLCERSNQMDRVGAVDSSLYSDRRSAPERR